eukprot:899965-Alexandrium_andersonii.AAC.1
MPIGQDDEMRFAPSWRTLGWGFSQAMRSTIQVWGWGCSGLLDRGVFGIGGGGQVVWGWGCW